jgi:hypothetical protein
VRWLLKKEEQRLELVELVAVGLQVELLFRFHPVSSTYYL